MSESITYYERRAYTFMDLLGDFGGFNDAIIFIVSTVFASYSASMFEATIASSLDHIKRKRQKPTFQTKIEAFRTKIASSADYNLSLDRQDL